jgi:hypothetical protein
VPPPAQQVQTPYAPTAQPGYGPTTPPPSAYGYPQQGAQTPPPTPAYNLAPAPVPQQHPMSGPGVPGGPGMGGPNRPGRGGGRSSNTPLVVGVVVAVVAIAVIVGVVVAMTGGGGGDTTADHTAQPDVKTSTSATASASASDDVVQGDQTRTIETNECTDAHNDFINPDKPDVATMPDFHTDYVDSVVACMKAAGWKYTIKHTNEQLWGKGSVTSQSPSADDDYDPKTDGPVTIWVSTGKSSD